MEGAHPILYRHHQESTFSGVDHQALILPAITLPVPTAMDPDHHWQFGSTLGSIDVEEEAVFTPCDVHSRIASVIKCQSARSSPVE